MVTKAAATTTMDAIGETTIIMQVINNIEAVTEEEEGMIATIMIHPQIALTINPANAAEMVT